MRHILLLLSILFPYLAYCQVCVGSTEYNMEVTPVGQLSLTVPIKLPPGTGGLEPKLSVSYNGSTRRGLCGVGFDLEGLSIINRTPANLFNDNFTGAVEVCDSDRLMLDGQRLIKTGDLPGGRVEYHTERNNFFPHHRRGERLSRPHVIHSYN